MTVQCLSCSRVILTQQLTNQSHLTIQSTRHPADVKPVLCVDIACKPLMKTSWFLILGIEAQYWVIAVFTGSHIPLRLISTPWAPWAKLQTIRSCYIYLLFTDILHFLCMQFCLPDLWIWGQATPTYKIQTWPRTCTSNTKLYATYFGNHLRHDDKLSWSWVGVEKKMKPIHIG